MILFVMSFFIIVMSFNLFAFSYQLNGANRVVTQTPVAFFETAINVYEIDEDIGPKINKQELEDNLTSYFDYCLSQYCYDYFLSFYYYNPSNHAICTDNECQAVEVEINALLFLNYHYQKTMFYELRSN